MRALLKVLLIALMSFPFVGGAQEASPKPPVLAPQARFLPGNNLDILQTAYLLGYIFKWRCPREEGGKWYCQGEEFLAPEAFQDIDPRVIVATGFPRNGSATSDKEVTQWHFVFTLSEQPPPPPLPSPQQLATYTLFGKFDSGVFNPITFKKGPWMGVEIGTTSLSGEVEMPLDEAIELMRGAGFTDPFASVAIYRPLGPGEQEIVYLFSISQKYVFVGTTSKKVWQWAPSKGEGQRPTVFSGFPSPKFTKNAQ